jgi:hypothetical protein
MGKQFQPHFMIVISSGGLYVALCKASCDKDEVSEELKNSRKNY